MSHLTPEQFVDLAEGVAAETSLPHLASCDACRRQLASMRAMMSDVASVDASEPSPLFWDHLSTRVREAVAGERARPRSWRDYLLRPRVLALSLAGALAVALFAVILPGTPATITIRTTIPSTPLPMAAENVLLPSLPPLAPLGAADDPQLGFVADYGTTLDWDEMREEMALATPGGSSDAVAGALTVDEQRELQRLLAEEMAQPRALEIRS
jgi:hypothetical protein